MSKLTTQLEQARQEIAEREAESRDWEERAAGLSQQLKEERSKVSELIQSMYPPQHLHGLCSHCNTLP